MMSRLGLGPVFTYEWLIASRRWQVYAARSLFVAALLAALTVVWWSLVAGKGFTTFQSLASVGETFFYALAGTQLALVLMAAPAAAAGAVCHEKATGTLYHLLVTDLSDVEIVLGKLAARLIPVGGFLACTLPVMALGILLGGIDPMALLAAFLISLGVAVLGLALALALSVWATKTHEVLLATYMIWALWLLAKPLWQSFLGWTGIPPPDWFETIDPFCLAFAPYWRPGKASLLDAVGFVAGCLLISTTLVTLAVLKTRSVAIRQVDRTRPAARPSRFGARIRREVRWWPSPSLDANPVLWREWHRNRPSRWARVLGIVFVAVATAGTVMAIYQTLVLGYRGEVAAWVNGFQASIGLLFAAVLAATALSEERARGSLDVLLATPMSTPAIVWGKWWGAFRMVPKLAILPGLLSYALSWRNPDRWACAPLIVGLILSYGAALASLGLALSTWIGRLSRVMTLTVAIHVLITAGWLFLVMTINQLDDIGRGLALGSPFFGPGMLTAIQSESYNLSAPRLMLWAGVWIAVYTMAAVFLFAATLATFDRCLGRISDQSGPDRPLPRRSRPRTVPEPSLSLD